MPRLQVGAGGERPLALAAQDHHPDRAVVGQLEAALAQVLGELVVDRVQHLWSVEDQIGQPPVAGRVALEPNLAATVHGVLPCVAGGSTRPSPSAAASSATTWVSPFSAAATVRSRS